MEKLKTALSFPFRMKEKTFDITVFGFALALRLGFLALWLWKDMGTAVGRDLYYSLALQWAGWMPWEGVDVTHPPLYTAFIALVLACFRSPNPFPVLVIQSVMSAAVCLFIRRIGARLASETVGRTAALWVAVDIPLIFFAPQLQTETLFIFLFAAFAWWLYRALDDAPERRLESWSLGVFGGLCALCRSAFAAYPIFLILTLLKMRQGTKRVVFIALFCCGWAAPIAVWTARNWILYHQVIPISSQMGWNLYEGFTLDRETVRNHPFEMLAELQSLGITDPADINRHFTNKVLSFSRAHPLQAARIVLGKALLYWRPWLYDPYTPLQRALLGLYFTVLFALACAGIWANRNAALMWWPVYGFLLYFTATHAVFATFMRYRLPLEPFLCLLGARGLEYLLNRRKDS